ncbi:ATP-binding protein [Streptomyces sp. A1547]|uniref:ATP-binding protein n=1 Tax=Streptomyces sp. A1547 TaxID=2563105 RepID=UPI00109E508F|nr:ATP-binding protein [Streptomyces sp. A1547]THA29832.1 hypothetical protein E6W17_38840 [Streptomyces sp. A1547]
MSIAPAGSRAKWWASANRRGEYIHTVVIGARKVGKTTWFRRLAEERPTEVTLWNVRRVARAGSVDEVWSDLFREMGIVPGPEGDPLEDLEDHLDTLDRGPAIVIDDWDAAVDGRGVTVPDACYEVLDALIRFCLGQATTRTGLACLGLVLLTSLPDAADLEYFTRTVQRPTFERLSKLVTRSLTQDRFPMLDHAESTALLIQLGVPAAEAGEAARACGGWPWLLEKAAAAVRHHGRWTPEAVEEVQERQLPGLLDAGLLPCLAARPEVRVRQTQPIDYLRQELARGRAPEAFGLPSSFDDPQRPAPLVHGLLNRAFLVVDTENLRMPFQRHAEVHPDRYPDGLEAFLQPHVQAWLRELREKHNVSERDVWLVGRSHYRIDATVGAQTSGERLHLPVELREKARRTGDGSDDALMTAQVARRAERNPLARFVLASGDADAPLILELVGALDQVTVCTPWQASGKLRRRLPEAERLLEHTFPVPRPPAVSSAELAAARRARARGERR